MDEVISGNKDLVDLLVQVLLIVLPIVITWYVRTYVKGSKSERDISAIVTLSNSAIDFVENLDKRGQIQLPPEASKGVAKLNLASDWLESELARAGIKMDKKDAEQWISSEFQKRMGEIKMTSQIEKLANQSVALAQSLLREGALVLPPEADRITYLGEFAADWVVANYAKKGATISRDEALTWVRAALLQEVQQASGQDLTALTAQAMKFLEDLEKSGQLALQPGAAGGDVKKDLATAWLITEAAKLGLTVTSDQIAAAISAAFRLRDEKS